MAVGVLGMEWIWILPCVLMKRRLRVLMGRRGVSLDAYFWIEEEVIGSRVLPQCDTKFRLRARPSLRCI